MARNDRVMARAALAVAELLFEAWRETDAEGLKRFIDARREALESGLAATTGAPENENRATLQAELELWVRLFRHLG